MPGRATPFPGKPSTTRRKIVLQDQGTVKADQGTLQYDQVQLAFTNITAPITGRVGLRLVDPGNLATANSTTPLVVITQLQPMTVVFTIPEDNVTPVTSSKQEKGRSLICGGARPLGRNQNCQRQARKHR